MDRKFDLRGRKEETLGQLAEEIFQYLGVAYSVEDVQVGKEENITCIIVDSKRIKGTGEEAEDKEQCYFVGHGFGGSSLMNFAILEPLLQRGKVILWQIRGLGFSSKLKSYPEFPLDQTDDFFLQTISALISHFKPFDSTFVCHSFSAYLTFRFLLKHPSVLQKHVKQLILLSPIGITPAHQDYKNNISNCSDIFHFLVNKIGWTFRITYKWVIKTLLCCFREGLIDNYLRGLEIEERGREIMKKIVHALVDEEDGSQRLFFQYFRERVLPRIALEPLVIEEPRIKVTMIYGGEGDWVDKRGPTRIAEKYPQKIKILRIEECGHNIMFKTVRCLQLFNEILAPAQQ